MEILIEVSEGNKTSKLNMKGVSHDSEKTIIKNFFGIIGLAREPEAAVINVDAPQVEIATMDAAIVAEEIAKSIDKSIENALKSEKEELEAADNKVERPKRLPLIDSANRMTTKLGEVAKVTVSDQQKEHWITGIKVDDDGTERYRCYYWCPCGSKGKRYIPLGTTTISCRDCEKELPVKAATSEIIDGLPERDSFGNYFVAKLAIP